MKKWMVWCRIYGTSRKIFFPGEGMRVFVMPAEQVV
jgi:hypothetical protein